MAGWHGRSEPDVGDIDHDPVALGHDWRYDAETGRIKILRSVLAVFRVTVKDRQNPSSAANLSTCAPLGTRSAQSAVCMAMRTTFSASDSSLPAAPLSITRLRPVQTASQMGEMPRPP